MHLSNQVAVITGATKGIGFAVTHALAKAGCHLVLNARTEADLETLAAALQTQYPGISVRIFSGDVSDYTMVQRIVAETSQIDILINNAGIAGKTALLQEIPIEEIDRIIDVNLKAPIYWMKAIIPKMVAQGKGTIINLNSVAGRTAYPYWSIYCASKFGLDAITKSVREEQRMNGIKIVGIHPGAVDTPIWHGIEPNTVLDTERMLDPETIAEAVLYVLNQPDKVLMEDIGLVPQRPVL